MPAVNRNISQCPHNVLMWVYVI